MEPVWNRGGATGGNRWQTHPPRKPHSYLLSSGIGCIRLRKNLHGKEGVDGSSPSEGSRKSPAYPGLLTSWPIAFAPACSEMEQVLEQPDEKGLDLLPLLATSPGDLITRRFTCRAHLFGSRLWAG